MDESILKKFMKDVRKITESSSMDNSPYGEVKEWIDTGDFGLNRIISGDIYKGIPSGKIITVYGESQSGKSLLAAQIAANAVTKNNFDTIFYFDSEGGALKEFFSSRGCPANKIEHVVLENVEDAIVKITSTFDLVKKIKKEHPEYKCLFILDSLGGLVPKKFLEKTTEEDRVVGDQGQRAKTINNFIKSCTIPCLKADVAFVIINHVYDATNESNPSKIKHQSGGKGVLFMSRLAIQCSRRFQADDRPQDDKIYGVTILKYMTTKNSFVKPFITSEMFMDFSHGPKKYFGILKAAIQYGLLAIPSKGWYSFPTISDKKYRLKEVLEKDDIWEKVLPEFNERSKAEMSYSGGGYEITEDDEEMINDEAASETSTEAPDSEGSE